MRWIDKLFTKKPKGMLGSVAKIMGARPIDSYAQLAQLLADYPAHRPPHTGDPLHLSNIQCDENLADLLAQRCHRLNVLGDFLLAHGIDISPALQANASAPDTFAAIHQWLLAWLPKRPFDPVRGDNERNRPRDKFMASDRSGEEIYLSFFADLSLLLGEAIGKSDPRFQWHVFRAPDGEFLCSEEEPDEPPIPADDFPDQRHICLVKPSGDPEYWPTILNLHMIVQFQCHAMMGPMTYIDHPYGHSYNDALNRRFDRPENGIY
jgi:hypothetical protein